MARISRTPALFAAIVACALLAYGPALNGRLLWDDGGHVTRPELRSGHGLVRIWTEIGATQQYYPALHTAFWIEHRLWGDAPLGYHLANVLLHATAAFLVGLILAELGAAEAGWLAAFLFALHPVCVESVAWISEQKNTLSAVFYLLAALCYFRWKRSAGLAQDRPDAGRIRAPLGGYLLASFLFVLAVLSKSVTATLPAALLVIAWWRAGRVSWRRDVLPLLPWFAVGIGMGVVTSHVEHALIGAAGAGFDLDWAQRALLAARALWFYVGKVLRPLNLVFIYPKWTVSSHDPLQYVPLAACLAATGGLVWWWRRRGNRGPLAAAAYFAGTLFPALGFVNIYPFRYSYVADHFQYLACLGVLVPAAFAIAVGLRFLPSAGKWTVLAGLAVLLGALTRAQSGMYADVFTLYETTLRRNPGCWMAEGNLGTALVESGRVAEAIPHFERAIELNPRGLEAEDSLGDALNRLGRAAEAVPHLERVVRLEPGFAEAHNNLGVSRMMTGRPADGIAEFQEAVSLKPGFARARVNLGLALAQGGRTTDALPQFETAARLDPTDASAELDWAIALTVLDRPAEAVPHYERALRLDPASTDAHIKFSMALHRLGRDREAEQQYALARALAAGRGR